MVPARRPQVPQMEGAEVFFRELFEGAGLSLEAYRAGALHRRVPACLRFLRVRDVAGARAKLRANPELAEWVLGIVLLGVTEFCRDPAVFAELRRLIGTMWQGTPRTLRVWSAACSDGRELYSVSILLHQAGLRDAVLLGTDCRREAVRMARAGEFAPETLEGLEPWWREHFQMQRGMMRPSPHLRENMCWRQADLLRRTEPGPWDMILWRNMAIYLQPEAARRVWLSLMDELAPGGLLVTGKADYPPPHPELERVGPCVYRRRTHL